MSFLNALVKYSIGGFAFYIKPRVVVREILEREDTWYTIATIAAAFALAQLLIGYLDVLGRGGELTPHFSITYRFIANLTVTVVASAVIFAFSRLMAAGADFKTIYRGVILKFPIAIAFSLSLLGIKYAVFGFLSLFSKDTGMTLGWYFLAAVAVGLGPFIKALWLLRQYGIWSWSAVAVAVQLFLVSKHALKTNIFMAVAVTLSAAVACWVAAALIFFARYHGFLWKITSGALFS